MITPGMKLRKRPVITYDTKSVLHEAGSIWLEMSAVYQQYSVTK